MDATPLTKKMVEKAKKVFGPVAETLAAEALKRSRDEISFRKEYIEELVRITGRRELVENIINNNK
ncbi:MAG: hypothetical protein QXS93_02070 [Candidatus Micrarchaeia archaeon]